MTTKAQLENSLKEAMKAGDEVRKRVLRQVLSAIRLTEIDKGSALDEVALLAVVQKEAKSYQETYDESIGAGRTDLAEKAQAEIEVIQGFLPKQLPQEELEQMVRQVIDEVGATSLREMGQVMKVLMPRLQGQATGDQASQMVKKLLV
jgi:uncharacterized protein YqeY